MAELADGYYESWQQYKAEIDDEQLVCDECDAGLGAESTYWAREDEILCETCFKDWRED